MVYEVGLILSVAIGSWLALDYVMAEAWVRRSPGVALLGGAGALWAAAELLIDAADTPGQLAFGRRLLYLGIYGGTFCWYWVAVVAHPPAWYVRDPRRIAWLALPFVALYSLLFVAPDGTIVSLTSEKPVHGPLFMVAAVVCWSFIVAGIVRYSLAAFRLGRVRPARAAALVGAFASLIVMNVLYVFGVVGPTDPTPACLGVAALLIRLGVVDPGLALYLPLARKDIVEQLAVGVLVADVHGTVIDSNRSAQALLAVDDPRGRTLDALCAQLDESVEALRFPLRSHVAVTGHAAVLTDRREAVEAERRLKVAGRLQAVGSLTAGMAHEINNPLAYVRSNLNLIEKLVGELVSPGVNTRLPNHLRTLTLDSAESLLDAKDGIERITLLVARLKDFARQTGGASLAFAAVDLADAARRAAAVAGVGSRPDAIRVLVHGDAIARSDEPAIVQIMVNLVLNALQASAGGGHASSEVVIDVLRGPDEHELRVSDRGPGLGPDALERMFDPFFTTKESGSGLGLSISYELARQLGGRIEARNRDGGGAIFSLFLPAGSGRSTAVRAGER